MSTHDCSPQLTICLCYGFPPPSLHLATPMTPDSSRSHLPSPCIIEQGIIVNKDDIYRLLSDLGQVTYDYWLDNEWQTSGEGWVMEVFRDRQQSTIVANQTLYLNVNSFDYLQLGLGSEEQTLIDLFQDNRQLRLVPLEVPPTLVDPCDLLLETHLDAVVSGAIAAQWDIQQEENK